MDILETSIRDTEKDPDKLKNNTISYLATNLDSLPDYMT